MEKKNFDAIIIGFGKGGKTLAAELAKRNWQVAMIERSDKMYGGTCPNIACIPTKALVHEAEVSHLLFPGNFDRQAVQYTDAIGRKNNLTGMLRKKFYDALNNHPNVTVFTGEASFVSSDTVQVALPEGDIEIQGKEIFINTGSTPVIPPIEGLKESHRTYTSKELLDLEVLPQHLIIVGGGYIGLEFASMYAGFGSKVTVLEGGDKFIGREDRDMAEQVQKTLEKKGITILLNARAQGIQDHDDKVSLIYKDAVKGSSSTLEGDAILIATGRKPMTQGLNLQAAGIATDERGAIVVDEHLHTNVPHIWAMGDVKGGLQFTYISLDDYRIVRDALFSDTPRSVYDRLPVQYAVFIDPPLAHVGINEEEAKKKGFNYKVSHISPAGIPRARTLQQTDGLLKAIIDGDNGKILGCTLFCADASEMINIVAMAIKAGQSYTFLRDFVFTHPSMSEALNDLFDF